MKKIGITHIIPSLDVGGAERMLIRLLSQNGKERFIPSVISLMGEGELGPQIRDMDIPVRTVEMRSSIPQIKSIYRLSSHVNNLNPDLVVGWMYHGNLAATWAAFGGKRRPLIWNIRHSLIDINLEKPMTRYVIKAGALLSRSPQKIIYNSQVASLQHEKAGYQKNNRIVVPNGFELDRFIPDQKVRARIRKKLSIGSEDQVIGLVGRSHPTKNYKEFILSLARFKEKLAGVKIIIAGRGVDDKNGNLHQAVKQSSLSEIVILLPQTDQPEMLYQTFDLLALPSLTEAFPNVVGEAMACGVPCLVTDVGDASILVGDTGFVSSRDMNEFTNILINLLNYSGQELKKLGAKARLRMLENYEISDVTKRYNEIFDELTIF